MWGKVRCKCGRYMREVGQSLATYVSGGCVEYECSRCGAKAEFWSRAGVDDELSTAVWIRGEEERSLEFNYKSWEWRVT
jgi:hypothetical protein